MSFYENITKLVKSVILLGISFSFVCCCLPFVRVCEWGKGGRVATGEGVRVSGGGGGVGVGVWGVWQKVKKIYTKQKIFEGGLSKKNQLLL